MSRQHQRLVWTLTTPFNYDSHEKSFIHSFFLLFFLLQSPNTKDSLHKRCTNILTFTLIPFLSFFLPQVNYIATELLRLFLQFTLLTVFYIYCIYTCAFLPHNYLARVPSEHSQRLRDGFRTHPAANPSHRSARKVNFHRPSFLFCTI